MKKYLIGIWNDPIHAYHVVKAILKGYLYKIWYQYIKRKGKFGKKFRVNGTLCIKGPGMVIMGDNVRIGMTVTPWTDDKNAVIEIGNNVLLNGTRFGCKERITVEDDAILADCRIMDTDYHGINPAKRHVYKTAPVIIERNVWVAIQCIILKGVTIGEGSTIAAGSVVTKSIPAFAIASGNPAEVCKSFKEKFHD